MNFTPLMVEFEGKPIEAYMLFEQESVFFMQGCVLLGDKSFNISVTSYTSEAYYTPAPLVDSERQIFYFVTLIEFGSGYIWHPFLGLNEVHQEALAPLVSDPATRQLLATAVNILIDAMESPREDGSEQKFIEVFQPFGRKSIPSKIEE